MRSYVFRLLVLSVLCAAGCDAHQDPLETEDNPRVCTPASEDDPNEWPLASSDEAGLVLDRLDSALAVLLPTSDHGIHSMLVVRHGKLVVERYWIWQGGSTPHDMRSATKSITSLLVGVAIDRGAISNVSEPVMLRLREAYPTLANPDSSKDLITIENLLRMESGLACNDWDPASPGNEARMYPKRDWVRFFLDLPVKTKAAVSSRYCTAGVVTLGRVVKEATRETTRQFADETLLAPLGIRNYCWSTFDHGQQVDTGGHLYLRARDMAKIGQLVLQQGRWNGEQIVSAAWIDQSTRFQTMLDGRQPYGYLWWLHTATVGGAQVPYVAAQGNGGQFIFVIPSYDMVVVFTGGNYDRPATSQPFTLLQDAVLPAFSRP